MPTTMQHITTALLVAAWVIAEIVLLASYVLHDVSGADVIVSVVCFVSVVFINYDNYVWCGAQKGGGGSGDCTMRTVMFLSMGYWLMFSAQLWFLVNNTFGGLEMYVSAAVSFITFACTAGPHIFFLWCRQQRRELKPPSTTDIVILEGLPAVGKTSIAHYTFDYLAFLEVYPLYIMKHEYVSLTCLYNLHLLSAMFQHFSQSRVDAAVEEEEAENSVQLVDRGFISQVVFSILHEFDGTRCDINKFKSNIETYFEKYGNMIREAFLQYEDCLSECFPDTNINVQVYCLPRDSPSRENVCRFIKKNIEKRKTFENRFPDLETYIYNTDTVWRTLMAYIEHPGSIFVSKDLGAWYLSMTDVMSTDV